MTSPRDEADWEREDAQANYTEWCAAMRGDRGWRRLGDVVREVVDDAAKKQEGQ